MKTCEMLDTLDNSLNSIKGIISIVSVIGDMGSEPLRDRVGTCYVLLNELERTEKSLTEMRERLDTGK